MLSVPRQLPIKGLATAFLTTQLIVVRALLPVPYASAQNRAQAKTQTKLTPASFSANGLTHEKALISLYLGELEISISIPKTHCSSPYSKSILKLSRSSAPPSCLPTKLR